jgi:twitching motility protein PilJ
MQVVREISSQTAEGSTATSTSIAKLAALSAQLRKSVAGFRLPDYSEGTTTMSTQTVALPAAKEPESVSNTPRPRKASGVGA